MKNQVTTEYEVEDISGYLRVIDLIFDDSNLGEGHDWHDALDIANINMELKCGETTGLIHDWLGNAVGHWRFDK